MGCTAVCSSNVTQSLCQGRICLLQQVLLHVQQCSSYVYQLCTLRKLTPINPTFRWQGLLQDLTNTQTVQMGFVFYPIRGSRYRCQHTHFAPMPKEVPLDMHWQNAFEITLDSLPLAPG